MRFEFEPSGCLYKRDAKLWPRYWREWQLREESDVGTYRYSSMPWQLKLYSTSQIIPNYLDPTPTMSPSTLEHWDGQDGAMSPAACTSKV